MGAVMVLSTAVEVEGFTSTAFASSNVTFSTPAANFTGAKDMLVAAMLDRNGITFDMSGSGLTKRANPKALPFSSMELATTSLSSGGTTPTYTFTTSDATKPGIMVFGLQRLR